MRILGMVTVASALAALLGAHPAVAAETPSAAADGQAAPAQVPERARAIEPILDQPGILTERGHWIFEPSLQYANSTNTRVALLGVTYIPSLLVGVIDIRSISRDSLIAALTARYGLTHRLELETKVPYIYRQDKTTGRAFNAPSSNDQVFETEGNGVGDVEVALRYQLSPGVQSPIYIAGLRVKTRTGTDPFEVGVDPATGLETELPTGSGFWGVQPSVTMIHISDPAVFSTTVSYLWHLERNVGGTFGEVDPGDVLGFNFGMGLGLNERASFSIGYEHNIVGKTTQNGAPLANSTTQHLGSLLFGVAYRVSPRTNINFSVAAGLTEAAPDVQVTLRVPMRF